MEEKLPKHYGNEKEAGDPLLPVSFSSVILDMDGLLLDTEALGLWAWQHAVQDFGLFLPDEVFSQMIGLSRHDSDQILFSFFGKSFPLDAAREKRIFYGSEYVKRYGIGVKSGVDQLLAFLNNKSIPYALATSTVKEITLERLRATNLISHFPCIVTGEQVFRGKPEPDIFLLAAEQLGVQPTKCVVIEDSENGIRAAHRAGMTPIMVPDLKQPTEEIRHLAFQVCENLQSVINLLSNFTFET